MLHSNNTVCLHWPKHTHKASRASSGCSRRKPICLTGTFTATASSVTQSEVDWKQANEPSLLALEWAHRHQMLMFAQSLVKAAIHLRIRSTALSETCSSSLGELHLCVSPVRPLGVYTHHALLITSMSLEPLVTSPAITGIKPLYSINWSYLLIALIACIALRITWLVMSLNLWLQNKRQTYVKQWLIWKSAAFALAVGWGIFTRVLRTECQVAAGKPFVVPWWGIGVFDLDLLDCLWAVGTHHVLQLSIVFCRGARTCIAFSTSINNFSAQ